MWHRIASISRLKRKSLHPQDNEHKSRHRKSSSRDRPAYLIFIQIERLLLMRHTLPLILGVLLLAATALSQRTTVLSYLADLEAEQRQDFLELTVSVSSFKTSLQQAIAEAREKAENIKTLEEEICRAIAKTKSECKGSAEVGNVRITPKYEENKKEMEYKGITASYQVLIRVLNPDNFGELVDKILTLEGFVITSIEWQPDESKLKNTFLADSLEKSKLMCKELGLAFQRLVSVEQVREEPPEEEEEPEPECEEDECEEEEPEEEEPEEEEDEDVTTYRITIECVEKPKGKAEKEKGEKVEKGKKK